VAASNADVARMVRTVMLFYAASSFCTAAATQIAACARSLLPARPHGAVQPPDWRRRWIARRGVVLRIDLDQHSRLAQYLG